MYSSCATFDFRSERRGLDKGNSWKSKNTNDVYPRGDENSFYMEHGKTRVGQP